MTERSIAHDVEYCDGIAVGVDREKSLSIRTQINRRIVVVRSHLAVRVVVHARPSSEKGTARQQRELAAC